MELRQLKYFLIIAEEGLITKAAVRLNITQPPLSQQMIALEKEFGVQLFRRTKKHIFLTEAGEVLKRRSEQILELVQLTTDEVRETTAGVRGKLTIGIINSSGRLLLPEIVRIFHQQYPHVSFDLRQGDTHHIVELLDSHLIDVGFIRLPIDLSQFDSVPVPIEKMVMVVHKDLLPLDNETMDLIDLKEYPLLIHRRYEAIVTDYFHKKGTEANILCTSDEMIPLLTWSLRGLGIAVVPEFSTHLLSNPNLIVRTLNQPTVTSASALIWRKNELLPAAATNFIDLFQKHLEEKS
jgi:DNA-binding transcriptional LysR family regulator